MISLVLLALVFTAKVSSTNIAKVAKDVEKVEKVEKKVSPEVMEFYTDIDHLLMKFDCDRGALDCEALRAVDLIDDDILGINDCDEAADTPGLCKDAKKLLSVKQNRWKVLAQNSKMLFDEQHAKYENELGTAVTDYVCFKIPSDCEDAR
jgi:hypothetical protein